MSFESPKSSMFTFQSSVHSAHVLQCLDKQRQKDVLCDVTVVVEDTSFRAHCVVLAACSDYFQTRIASHAGQGLVITLPIEVTVEGFEPLLQFAYTAKLLFTKENILEIRKCAAILGFHNLDKACFEFLVPKFFDDTKDPHSVYRKSCWKKRCCKRKLQVTKSNCKTDNNGNEEEEVEHTDSESPDGPRKQAGDKPCRDAKLSIDVCGRCSPVHQEKTENVDYSALCPEYCGFTTRKQHCLDTCPGLLSESNSRPRICSDSEDQVQDQVNQSKPCPDHITHGKEVVVAPRCLRANLENLSATSFVETQHFDSGHDARSSELKCYLLDSLERPNQKCTGDLELVHQGSVGGLNQIPSCSQTLNNKEGDGERSRIEREVAEHLTAWSGSCFSPLKPCEASCSIGVPWTRPSHLDPSKEDCPFLLELRQGKVWVPGCEKVSIPEKSPCIFSVHSGEDSDFDTEGDSECYINERAREVQLPFSVEEIASLSRNDFQQLLKVRQLTPEQLDLVHDARRRSKNRMAAQRCRKRKLDCIHNLECEIGRLRSEKEKLLQERNHLNQLRQRTQHNLTDLCQRVCREARLQPDQLQVLAKYTSPECPLSVLITEVAPPPPGQSAPDQDHVLDLPLARLADPVMDTPLTRPPASPKLGLANPHNRLVDGTPRHHQQPFGCQEKVSHGFMKKLRG